MIHLSIWMFILTLPFLGLGIDGWAAEKDKAAKKKQAQATQQAKPDKPGKSPSASIADKSTACFGLTPKIEKISPDEVKAGDQVKITGYDFGSPGCLSSVSFGPGHPAKFVHDSDTLVTVTVPTNKKGLVIVTVTTASGEDSKAVLVK
jgi:hypothetical protein